ncbi:mannosyl-glycoprotein endo-beta-N-acetylglucosamidase [Peribacillus cavernae]|uniref:Mannosyl-glycoprotein endo-beta-N-acetylglucosamidase n=1 Tax=Peribacillus cavernae TaxID=1674310 RepID=A0A433HAE1_9BACI|nr:SH3 domain-containing protein [Peribacillus cavernae]RUQ25172.1 mannosyl-glycoprotein endo-beta-N-acetylglucosamidase [Peribacillus cavernae]
MKNIIIPSLCFAVLSTAALEQTVNAAPLPTQQVSANTSIKYVNVSPGSDLSMRKSASTNAALITKLSKGTQVTVYSQSNGWSRVNVNGKTGYVSSQYLTSTKPPGTSSSTQTTTKYVNVSAESSLNLRKSVSTGSPLVARLTKGTQVTVYSESKDWSKIKVNGKEGYVSSKYLTSTNPTGSTSTKSSTSTKTPATSKYVSISAGSLNLRKSLSESASVIAKLSKGTKVTVYSESNGWARINANGKDGYVSSKYLSASNPSPTVTATKAKITTKYVSLSSGMLNMRKSASSGANIVTRIAKGTQVTVYSESNGWAKIKASGKEGYVSTKYLSATKPGTAKPVPEIKTTTKYINVSSGSLNMRSKPSTTASVLVKLEKDMPVTVYSESNGWAKIKASGKEGYVSTKYLSTTKPGTAKPVPEIKTTTKYINLSSGSLNMRSKPSTTASVLVKLAKGMQVTVYYESNGWSKIKANGKEGYVGSKYLSPSKPGVEETEPEAIPTTKYINVSAGSLNMRNKPSADGSIIVKLAKGMQVTVYSESNGWAKIKVYGEEGYVSSEYLSATKPGTSPNTDTDTDTEKTTLKFVNVSAGAALNMRSAASPTASILTKLAKDTAVTVYSEVNGWARVSANGKTGYIRSKFLVSKAPENPGNPTGTIDRMYQNYDLTLSEMTAIQMKANPQTDKDYKIYIREDGLALTSPTKGTVKGTGWRVRGGAGNNFWVVGTVSKNQTLEIKSKVEGSDGYNWFEVSYNKSWVNASPEDVTYYVDANNFVDHPINSFQFVKLSQTTHLNASEVNERILSGKGILSGKAASFISAGETYGVNEMYLISHALLETGNGTSPLATGINVNGRIVYNMYGIGAFDGTAISSGAQYAYNAGWFTPEASIIGGAQFIAQGYVNTGQDTLYKMRWNPISASINGYASHQYATDIGWASKQVKQIYNLYSLLDSYKMTLEIPKYK